MMKLTITINMKDGGEPTASAQVIDLPATEVFPASPKRALPKPRPFWKLSALDLAVVAGTAAGFIWLLS